MSSPAAEPLPLAQRFALQDLGDELFQVVFEQDHPGPVFGGDILGCATRAGALSVDDKPMTSLYMRFLRPVFPNQPVDFRVERTRDGRRLAHRRVIVELGGKACCELVLGFARAAEGPDRAGHIDVSAWPSPDELPSEAEVARAKGWDQHWLSPFEWRWIGDVFDPRPGESSTYHSWVRPRSVIGAERALQASAIAYLSDFHSHFSVARLRSAEDRFEPMGYTSLDTVIWLHRDRPFAGWRLLVTECDVVHAGRALTRRQLYGDDGALIASMAQEALIPDE
jgi:acyl-CoA thioesterase-2